MPLGAQVHAPFKIVRPLELCAPPAPEACAPPSQACTPPFSSMCTFLFIHVHLPFIHMRPFFIRVHPTPQPYAPLVDLWALLREPYTLLW
jgi:hypothetical protein